ncbi:MAG: ATP-binding protein [Bacteroidota bacterium]
MDKAILEDIFESIENGIIVFSPVYDQSGEVTDFRYEQINQLALQLIKKQRHQLTGSTLLTAFPDLRGSELFQQYLAVINGVQSFRSEFHYQNEEIDTWYRNYAFRLGEYLIVQFTDISEYRQIVEEKSRNEGLYQAIVRTLPSNLDLLLVNRAFEVQISKGNPLKALGIHSAVSVSTSLNKELAADEFEPIRKKCQQSFKGETIREEVSEEDTVYRLSYVPVYDHGSVAFGCLIVAEDIGIFNLSEDELRNKLYALESAKESLEQFAYVASHDLQEPLRKIRAFGDRIATRYADKLDDTGQDYFERMQGAAGRMQTLIDDLLKYSRVGRIQNGFEPVDLNKLLDTVVDDLETTIEESGAKVEVGELPTVEGEATQLRQLFQNLLSNAIKFKREGVLPRIAIQAILLSAEQTNLANQLTDYYKITVQDNGIGFEEKYLDRIFNIFQRLHGRNQYPGTGIGLAICRKIIDNHQGDIYATSRVGEGSSFHIILPQQQTTMS